MRQMRLSDNVTVFLLFFGVAMLEAFASRRWWSAIFWVFIALLFGGASWLSARTLRGPQ